MQINEIKIGDVLDCLFSDGRERIGKVVAVDKHLVTVRTVEGTILTAVCWMCKKIE